MMTLNGFCDGTPGQSGVYMILCEDGMDYTACHGCAVCDPSIPNHETEPSSAIGILNRMDREHLCEFPMEFSNYPGQSMLCGNPEWHPFTNRCADHRHDY